MGQGWEISGQERVGVKKAWIEPGTPVAGGYEIRLLVDFLEDVAPGRQPSWFLWATSVEASIETTTLGSFRPLPGAQPLLPRAYEPRVIYSLVLDGRRLDAVEDLRQGKDLNLNCWFYANRFSNDGRANPHPMAMQEHVKVDARTWTETLSKLGYSDFIHIEIPIPRTADGDLLRAAAGLLEEGLAKQQQGEHADAVGRCRMVLDAIKQAGFGGRPPEQILSYLQQDAGSLTVDERTALMRATFRTFCSPAAHGRSDREEFTRDDATFALATTAALLRLVPRRLAMNPSAPGPAISG